MQEFFTSRDPSGSCITQWGAFKAYLQGLLIMEFIKVKLTSSGLKDIMKAQVQELEDRYIADSSG